MIHLKQFLFKVILQIEWFSQILHRIRIIRLTYSGRGAGRNVIARRKRRCRRDKNEKRNLGGYQQRDIMVVRRKRKLRRISKVDKIVGSHWRSRAEQTTIYYYRAASIILASFRRKGDEICSWLLAHLALTTNVAWRAHIRSRCKRLVCFVFVFFLVVFFL